MLQSVEKEAGRERKIHWGPRTLDLDILFYEDFISDEADLMVPHPDMQTEIAYDVDDNPHAYYIQQAGNGLFAREAIFCDVLGIDLYQVRNDQTIIP